MVALGHMHHDKFDYFFLVAHLRRLHLNLRILALLRDELYLVNGLLGDAHLEETLNGLTARENVAKELLCMRPGLSGGTCHNVFLYALPVLTEELQCL